MAILGTADQFSQHRVGGTGLVLTILVCQFVLYALLAVGLWRGGRLAVVATAIVLVGEATWALLVSVSNDLYTPYFMNVMVLSVVALVAIIPARLTSVRGKASAR
jgi:hypothetical protein